MSFHDVKFDAMGCEVRLLVGEPAKPGLPAPASAAESARRFIRDFDARLSRFSDDSELSLLNRDPAETVPASPLLCDLVRAALWAAERTDGLVDPTLVRALEAVGYARSRAGVPAAPLAEALEAAPPRRPARPDPARRWRQIAVDESHGTVSRPPGLAIDSGGVGKGLAADLLAERLAGYSRFVVDCGGDLRVGGVDAAYDPLDVHVEHPISGERSFVLRLGAAGIATSGLNVRLWRRADGSYGHHLLDPATGEPVWSGLVGVTALGATALEAETLAKAALLSGPERGRELLAERGGLIVHESGRVEMIGALRPKPRLAELQLAAGGAR
jgi:thiamine biosynthesis lipoprotein